MKLYDWLKRTTEEEQQAVAEVAGTKVTYLRQLAIGHRQSSWKLAEKLEDASVLVTPDRRIAKAQLRPDIADYF